MKSLLSKVLLHFTSILTDCKGAIWRGNGFPLREHDLSQLAYLFLGPFFTSISGQGLRL